MADELNNPLFEDEREFLERKKQEYERALRGDVEHIKEQGTQVGKVALVGAGLAGSVWLITRVLGGKSKRKKNKDKPSRAASYQEDQDYSSRYDFDADDDFELDDEAFSLDRSAEFRGDGHDSNDRNFDTQFDDYSSRSAHSARESARVFMAHDEHDQQPDLYDHNDDLDGFGQRQGVGSGQGFDNGFGDDDDRQDDLPLGRLDFGPAVHQHRGGSYQPAQSFAYDDSRRLPESENFSEQENSLSGYRSSQNFQTAPDDVDVAWPDDAKAKSQNSLGKRVGGMVMSFLGTTTGKAVAAQATAAALAYITNKMNDKQPTRATGKNADLASAPATTSFYGSPPVHTPSSPAVSLTLTDAPTEHPAS
ncbi:hypothetical protein [uncultured Hymenobacter sp.]|uniref:hypothetical protein n=1 Tax=uncultured Hymenobacter sp. TaxID=170016 RepID=UPI0035CAF629